MRHFLLDPRGHRHQDRHHHGRWVRLAQIHPQETVVHWNRGMDRHKAYPRIQFVRKVDQILRIVEQRLDQHSEQPNEDRHLHYQRAQASDRVDAAFPIQAHRFLGHALPVSRVPLLDFPDFGLQPGHGAHLAQLTHCQGDCDDPHQHGKQDDCQSHLGEAEDVQHQQNVEHWPNDDLSPEVTEYGKNLH